MPAKQFLMIPGPTPVPDEVLEAISRHPLAHRSPEFSRMLRECTDRLKWLAGDTRADALLITGSGTSAMDAAISNTINREDKVLSLVCGVFSERWAKIAEAYEADVERLSVEPGRQIPLDVLRNRLAADKQHLIKAVTI